MSAQPSLPFVIPADRPEVQRRAPLVKRRDQAGYDRLSRTFGDVSEIRWEETVALLRAWPLECGHVDGGSTGGTRVRCLSCLHTVTAGPYLCSGHPECRQKPKGVSRPLWVQMRTECWNESALGRPCVADVIAARIR